MGDRTATFYLVDCICYNDETRWLVLSKPLVSPPEARPLASSLRPRLRVSLPLPRGGSKNLTVIAPVPWLFARSASTKRAQSCSSASFPSNVWFVKSRRTSRPIFASKATPSSLFKKQPKHTLWVSSKTPTCAPFMLRGLPLCPRTSSLLVASVASVRKRKLAYQPIHKLSIS